MVGSQKDGTAVDAARKGHSDWLFFGNKPEPFSNFLRQRSDITPANLVQVCGQGVTLRREKAGVSRVWVGAANQLNLDDIMGRYHSCVARMELTGESLDVELLVYGIDAIGNDQRRTLLAFGKKVA